MIISKLTNSLVKKEVLTEANYDLPANTSSGTQQATSQSESNTPEDLVNNFFDQQNVSEEQMNQIDSETQTTSPNQNTNNNQENLPDNQPDDQQLQQDDNIDPVEPMGNGGNENNIPDVPDDYNPKNDFPKLNILTSLSDKEYKLSNLRCYEQFKELYKNIDDTINTNIMSITTKNKRQRQVVDIVHNNFSNMLTDINKYMILKFGDIYEDNLLSYITFLKRYHIGMKLIRTIVDENTKGE